MKNRKLKGVRASSWATAALLAVTLSYPGDAHMLIGSSIITPIADTPEECPNPRSIRQFRAYNHTAHPTGFQDQESRPTQAEATQKCNDDSGMEGGEVDAAADNYLDQCKAMNGYDNWADPKSDDVSIAVKAATVGNYEEGSWEINCIYQFTCYLSGC